MAVSMVIMAKMRKNPRPKATISVFLRLSREKPTTIGISGKTHGDIIEATPAKKDSRKPVSILFPCISTSEIKSCLKVDPGFDTQLSSLSHYHWSPVSPWWEDCKPGT